MAIFYEHVKGAVKSNNNIFYDWIKWSTDYNNKWPTIEFKDSTEDSPTSLGQIITTGPANTQQNFASNKILSFTGTGGLKFYKQSTEFASFLSTTGTPPYLNIQGNIKFTGGANTSVDFNCVTQFAQSLTINCNPEFKSGLTVKNNTTTTLTITNTGIVNTPGAITSDSAITGLYFNATSDKRAKENLTPLSLNALDIIKKVQIYTFNYKDSGKLSLGLLAQDLKDLDINGFNLIDNLAATGENGDYMQVKESKLIYILWKAIQEQQQQINLLQDLVVSLSSK